MSLLKVNELQNVAGSSLLLSSGNTISGPLSQMTGFKNRIINGDMRIDQRNNGASVTLTAANFVYPVDRFFAGRSSGVSGAIAQRVAGSITGGNALRVQRNSGDSSTALLGFGQVIESSNCVGFAGGTITRSFRARCGANFSASGSQITSRIGTGTGTNQSAGLFWNNGWTGQTNSDATITLTTSWQTFSVTTSVGATVNQVGLIFFWTPTGTAGSDDWVEIEQVQLEKGSVATPFEFRSIGQELALCQRYFFMANFSVTGNLHAFKLTGRNNSVADGHLMFPVSMRANPTMGATGPINAQLPGLGGISFATGLFSSGYINGCTLEATGGSSLSTGYPALLTNGTLAANAEL